MCSLGWAESFSGDEKKRKAKRTQRVKKKVGKFKIKKKKETQKEDIDELLEILEEKGNRIRANGNPTDPISVTAFEPLGHGLLRS